MVFNLGSIRETTYTDGIYIFKAYTLFKTTNLRRAILHNFKNRCKPTLMNLVNGHILSPRLKMYFKQFGKVQSWRVEMNFDRRKSNSASKDQIGQCHHLRYT